jgi:Contractile injection system tube protein
VSDERPARAVIYRLKETKAGTAEKPPTVQPDGDPITVQFNPTSLKIERSNDTSGGAITQAQRRHRPNEGHATLSLELEYDTAEGGPDGWPLDVRSHTQDLRQFAEPPKNDPKKAPPRLRFIWGEFTFDGIVTRISEDIDYFNGDGLALRAKVSLTITGQDEAFESNAVGPGARKDDTATPPGGAQNATGPGSKPASIPDMAADAQDGESVQQALSRLGLDPAAWRSAMSGLSSPLGLSAGVQLQVDASVSAGAGLGVTAGFSAGATAGASIGLSAAASAGLTAAVTAGVSASAGAAADVSARTGQALELGLPTGAGASAGAGVTGGGTVGGSAQADAGFALAAVGGIDAAAQGVLAAQVDAGVAAARGSFAVPGSTAPSADLSGGTGIPAGATASLSAGASAAADLGGGVDVSAGAGVSGDAVAAVVVRGRPQVDTRAVTFGRGVPLKPPVSRR